MALDKPVAIAIVGTGGMAHSQARAFKAIPGVQIRAACDIVPGKARSFADEFGIPRAYEDLDQLLTREDIDAVTVVTPDASHAETSLKVIAYGKHILCEKPLATCYADALRMSTAAHSSGRINMVNLSYRNASAIQKAHQLVEQGVLGRILHVEASYLQSWLSSKVWGDWRASTNWLWRLSSQHGSAGVLGDIGVHILDFATFVAGDLQTINCQLKTFPKIEGEQIGDYVLDANDLAVINVTFTGGALGTIHTSRWATGHANSLRLRVFGEKASLVVDLDQSYTSLKICQGEDVDHAKWKTLRCGKTPNNYQRFIHSIRSGVNDQPDFARGAQVQKWLDASFASHQAGTTQTV